MQFSMLYLLLLLLLLFLCFSRTQLKQSIEINAFPTMADAIVKISSSNASKVRLESKVGKKFKEIRETLIYSFKFFE